MRVGRGVLVCDDRAVEEGKRLSQHNRDDDESYKQQEIDGCHDQEAEIGLGVEEGNADEAIERCHAGLRRCVSIKQDL